MIGRPFADGFQLAAGPDEVAGDGAVVGAIGVDAVLGGDDVVEPESVGERLDEVVRRGGGEDDRPAGLAVLLEDRPGERLDHRRETFGGGLTGVPHRLARPALGETGGLAGQHHRRQRLADAC